MPMPAGASHGHLTVNRIAAERRDIRQLLRDSAGTLTIRMLSIMLSMLTMLSIMLIQYYA